MPEDIDTIRQRLHIATPSKYLRLVSRIRSKIKWRNGPIFHAKELASV